MCMNGVGAMFIETFSHWLIAAHLLASDREWGANMFGGCKNESQKMSKPFEICVIN